MDSSVVGADDQVLHLQPTLPHMSQQLRHHLLFHALHIHEHDINQHRHTLTCGVSRPKSLLYSSNTEVLSTHAIELEISLAHLCVCCERFHTEGA